MIRLFVVLILAVLILLILRSKSKSQNLYKKLIYLVIVLGVIFFLATSGKFILPQILSVLKVGLPFLTKFIGI